MKFFVPGKTFLVGEYAVLLGGVSLGVATKPYFEFDLVDDNDSRDVVKFHPESPAGKYLSRHNQLAKIIFNDKYAEKSVLGGFGRSTAEYFAAMTPDLLKNKKSFFDILKEYRSLNEDKKLKPSGMDLAFQFFGGVTLADQALNFYQSFDWNFANLDFYLVSTGIKVQTHDHLAELELSIIQDLPPLSNQIANLYAENKEEEFLYMLRQWCDLLAAKGLTHENSISLKQRLEKNHEIELVKPCGALGADVLIIFFKKENLDSVNNILANNKIAALSSSQDLSAGFATQLRQYWGK